MLRTQPLLAAEKVSFFPTLEASFRVGIKKETRSLSERVLAL